MTLYESTNVSVGISYAYTGASPQIACGKGRETNERAQAGAVPLVGEMRCEPAVSLIGMKALYLQELRTTWTEPCPPGAIAGGWGYCHTAHDCAIASAASTSKWPSSDTSLPASPAPCHNQCRAEYARSTRLEAPTRCNIRHYQPQTALAHAADAATHRCEGK